MKFQVFKNGKLVRKFPVHGAYMFGTDGIPVRRVNITFSNGAIICDKPTSEAAGLSLLWPVEGHGNVVLPTPFLPERSKPYILNVELARGKLMQIINKREDWGCFDELGELKSLADQAQMLFVKALQNISQAAVAAKFADKSLKNALIFSEKLTVKQGQSLFQARSSSRGFGRGCLCCKIDPARIGEPAYIAKLLNLFSFVWIPVNWAQIEPEKGNLDFSSIDKCINALKGKRVALCAGPLLRFTEDHLPAWLIENPQSFERVREMAYQFISKVVTKYAGLIRAWSVISGMNSFNRFGFNFEQMLEMTRAGSMAVKAVTERAIKLIVISKPWGEYYATIPNTMPPQVYMDMVVQSGINFDAFGLEMQLTRDQAGLHNRDMMHISAILDSFAPIGKPLYVTEVQIPDNDIPAPLASTGILDKRSQWIEQFCKVALSKPYVDTVAYSRLADTPTENFGLLDKNLKEKNTFNALKTLQKVIFTR